MGLFGGLFGTSKGTTDITTSPWGPSVPHYKNIFGQAENLYNRGPAPLAAQTQGALADTISGQYLNPNSNPFFAQSVRDALGQAGSAFAGQYGGAAGNNLGNSGYQEGLARTLGTVATNAYSDNYARERQNQMGALSMGGFDPAWENLMRYKEAISTPYNTQTQPYYQNNTANTLGLGLGGLGLYNGLKGAGAFSGLGGLFGGGAAAATPEVLAGAGLLSFSDERVKENIERVGTHDSGVGIYKYNYIGDGKTQLGVLAQEFAQVDPDAVHDVGGVLAVDYSRV